MRKEKVTKQFFIGLLIGLMYGLLIGSSPAFDGLWVESVALVEGKE